MRKSNPLAPRNRAAQGKSNNGNINAAIACQQQGDRKKAQTLCEEILAEYPENPEALHLLGVLKFQQNQPAEAIVHLAQSVELSPRNAVFLNNYASVLKSCGKKEKALEAYHQALALQPEYVDALSNCGNLLFELDHYEEAGNLLRRALASNPQHAEAHSNLGLLLQAQGQTDAAIDHYERALALRSHYPEPLNNLGVLYVALGELKKAADYFEQALALRPDYVDALNNLGTVLLELDGGDRAKELLTKALQLNRNNPETLNNLGSAHYLCEEFDRAQAHYAAAMALAPGYADPVVNRARVLMDEGRYVEARDCLRRYVAQSAIDWEHIDLQAVGHLKTAHLVDLAAYWLILGWLLNDMSDLASALERFAGAYRLVPARNTRNSLVFANYVARLAAFRASNPGLYASSASDSQECLYVIGESHALSPCNLMLDWHGAQRQVRPIFCMGVKMWHLAKPGYSQHRKALESCLRSLPAGAHLLLTIGEIDCRFDEGIWPAHKKLGTSVAETARTTVNGYFDWLAHVLEGRQMASIVIQGIPARGNSLQGLEDQEARRDYLQMIGLVNQLMQDQAGARRWGFLDVYAATKNDLGVGNGKWHIDDIHLRPDFYAEACRWLSYDSIGQLEGLAPTGKDAALASVAANEKSLQAYNSGNALLRAGRLAEALSAYEAALTADRDNTSALFNSALVLYELGDPGKSSARLREVLQRQPSYPQCQNVLGHAELDAGFLLRAHAAFLAAASQEGAAAADHNFNLGKVMLERGRAEEALAANIQACKSAPGNLQYWAGLMLARQYATEDAIPMELSPWRQPVEPLELPRRDHLKPIRIGFVSADFCRHPVGQLLLPLLERLDKREIVAYCYSTGVKHDPLTEKIKSLSGWRDVRSLTDAEFCRVVAQDAIDILFDLAGYTRGHRLAVFAQRAAPIQVSWLGYADTTLVPAMDYVLMDSWHVPPATETRYSEKVLRMPASRFVFAPPEDAPPLVSPPLERNGHVTFGCFNNTAKLNDDLISAWSEILKRIPTARLILKWRYFVEPAFCAEIRERFLAAGVSAARLELRGWSSPQDLLKEYGDVDIALDPFPFTGGFTTFEALWMGVPVVTLAGARPIARQGLCLLNNMGRGEWVAETAAEYIAIACDLATRSDALAAARRQLRDQLSRSPLMDAERFAADFTALMMQLWSTRVSGKITTLTDANTEQQTAMKTFLHVGCGRKHKDQTTRGFNTPEWHELRFDIDQTVQPDIVGTMLDMAAVETASVDAVFSSHNIEHLYAHEVALALGEFCRALKADGFLVLTCPDLQSVCQLIAEDKLLEAAYTSPAGPIAPIDILYGLRSQLQAGNHYMAHKCGFTESVLRGILLAAGFANVATMRRGRAPFFDLYALATKSPCAEDRLKELVMTHFPGVVAPA